MIGYICKGCGVEPPKPCILDCPQKAARLAGAFSIPLRALREARRIEVKEMAHRMSMPWHVVADLERDAAFHGVEALHAYLNALDMTLELTAVDKSGHRTVVR